MYYSPRQQLTHPELADPDGGEPTIFLAIFSGHGLLEEIKLYPNPLKIPPNTKGRDGVVPPFDISETEEDLRGELGGFECAPNHVRPFSIPDIGLEQHPLPLEYARYLDEPANYDEEFQQDIRSWIEEGCGETLYGNDYFPGDDGEVTSS